MPCEGAPLGRRIWLYLLLLQLQHCPQLIPKGTQLLLLLVLPGLQLQGTKTQQEFTWEEEESPVPLPCAPQPRHFPRSTASPIPEVGGGRSSPAILWCLCTKLFNGNFCEGAGTTPGNMANAVCTSATALFSEKTTA